MNLPAPPAKRTVPLLVTTGATALLLLMPFAGGPPAAEAPRPPLQEAEDSPAAEFVDEWVREFFPGNPDRYEQNVADERIRRMHDGEQVYLAYCAGCHGESGDGQGTAAPYLVPRPRNFLYGLDPTSPPLYKFRSTATGQPPLPQDVEQTILGGLRGSAMPQHHLVDLSDVATVTEYVFWLSQSNEFRQAVWLDLESEEPDLDDEDELEEFYEDYVVEAAERIQQRWQQPRVLQVGPETERSEESVERGRQVYQSQGCHECHGDTGRGDGSSAPTLVDIWGYPVDPRDFSTGKFRAGSTGQDLYLRIHGGVSGTPMPAYEDLSNEDTWDLIHFIQSLSAGGAQ